MHKNHVTNLALIGRYSIISYKKCVKPEKALKKALKNIKKALGFKKAL